ncbi:MAG TPA: DUF4129 domain-containing protein [Roseiflexaceae bacterium]|nr:DUF4129 domain-containing protein [Roseiflexaceae bacterium]
MLSWQRIAYYLGLALIEATPAALLVTIAGGDAWAVLIGIVLLGALADWIVLRRLAPDRQRLALAGIGLLCALWLAKVQVAGDYGLLGSWDQALGAIFSVGQPRGGMAYLSVLAGLYCFWRGTRLTIHDRVTVHRMFRVIAISLLGIVGIGLLGARLVGAAAVAASTEVLAFFAVGLVTLALAGGIDEQDVGLHRLGWRGVLIVCGAVGVMLGLGVLVAALFGRDIAQIVGTLLQAIVLLIALIFAPLIWLLLTLLEGLLRATHLDRWLQQLASLELKIQAPPPPANGTLGIFPPWLQVALRVFFALLPIVLILALLMLARSRARRLAAADEERESLWSWAGLAEDLRGLLAGLRTPRRDGGLRAVLASLRGVDPASRIRRSYIRLLLLGQVRQQPRPLPQTPHEYAPTAGALAPGAQQSVDTLTSAYERARYHPQGVGADDAEAAERAWAAIEQAERRST